MPFRRPVESIVRFAWLWSLVPASALVADDLSGSDALLCYGLSAARCEVGSTCEPVEPWELNLPDFVKLDLRGKRAETTPTSAEQRETALQSVQRDNGRILIQGAQGERAFIWLITESSGEGTLSVAGHGQGLTVFTVCTAVDKL